jgi:hypothetical protein
METDFCQVSLEDPSGGSHLQCILVQLHMQLFTSLALWAAAPEFKISSMKVHTHAGRKHKTSTR